MDIRKENKMMLTDYFKKGIKERCVEKLGVELEHFIVDADSKESISYYGEAGIEAILEALSPSFPKRFEKDGHLIGIYNEDYSISLEPAGQLEVSIVPKEDIALIYKIYESFCEKINPIINKYHYTMVTMGYQPKSRVADLPLIPKKRYELMDRYFKKTGTCGINMMRGTAATQVSIDYYSELDFVLKIRAAYLIMPLFELLTDNSPVFEGEPYDKYMVRSYIWDNVDDLRTGIIPGLFNKDFGFSRYGEYMMNLPPIFTPQDERYTEHKTTQEVWAESLFTEEDIEHILSMSFADVRLKSYIEMRFADSMPIEYVLGYLVLIKGIFYDRDTLIEITGKLISNPIEIKKAQKSLAKYGFDGTAYGYNAGKLLLYLLERARMQVIESEQKLLDPLAAIIKNKRTLAEEYYEKNSG